MIGIIVLLAISWLLLHFVLKENLTILGIKLTKSLFFDFLRGFSFALLLCSSNQVIDSFLRDYSWNINLNLTTSQFFNAMFWDFKSVLTEELLFRGALLYILFKKLGVKSSILVSAVAFGIYHWFSYGIFGNVIPMIVIFLGTGIMGYSWALAYAKTKSIILPFALHFGWNLTQNTFFSKGPLGDLLFIRTNPIELMGYLSLLNFFIPMILMPILTLLFVKYIIKQVQ